MDHSSGDLEICGSRHNQVCSEFIADSLFIYDAFYRQQKPKHLSSPGVIILVRKKSSRFLKSENKELRSFKIGFH